MFERLNPSLSFNMIIMFDKQLLICFEFSELGFPTWEFGSAGLPIVKLYDCKNQKIFYRILKISAKRSNCKWFYKQSNFDFEECNSNLSEKRFSMHGESPMKARATGMMILKLLKTLLYYTKFLVRALQSSKVCPKRKLSKISCQNLLIEL